MNTTLSSIPRVSRVSLSQDDLLKSKTKIVAHVSHILGAKVAKIKLANELSNTMLEPTRASLQHSQDRASQISQLRAMNNAAAKYPKLKGHKYTNDLSAIVQIFRGIQPGLTILTPFWDTSWYIPNDDRQFVNSETDANDSMGVICHGSNDSASGFAASGYGVFISSVVQRPVSIRPYVPCDFSYSFWSLLYNSNSRGGYGMLIYDGNGNIVPNSHQEPEIWNRTSLNDSYTHIEGSDYLQFHLANGEFAFTMNAGETYQLWLWVWGHGDCSGIVFTDIFGNDYGSYCDFYLTASIPFIVIQ